MGDTKDDQKRTMNANEAIKEGSDYLIIGRPITKGDPKENIKNILASIE
jgi:orotidine-5'-phosphate decarboxylase